MQIAQTSVVAFRQAVLPTAKASPAATRCSPNARHILGPKRCMALS